MLKPAVPLAAFTENFSSMLLMAPPPLGKEIVGTSIALDLVLLPSVFGDCDEIFVFGGDSFTIHSLKQ